MVLDQEGEKDAYKGEETNIQLVIRSFFYFSEILLIFNQ
jgi:hypothetical protein